MRMRTWKSLTYTFATAGAFALLGAACGDDGGDEHDHDANVGDDAGEPDASIDAMPTATRSGTIAIADVNVTTPGAVAIGGLRGGSITIDISDLTQGGGEIIYGTSPLDGCIVTRYDETHTANPVVDIGTVTLSGNGFHKPVPAGGCTFVGGAYRCIYDAATGLTGSVVAGAPGAGQSLFSFTGEDFSGFNPVGMYLSTGGWTNASNNGSFPVLGAVGQTSLVVPQGTTVSETQSAEQVTHSLLVGAGPIPYLGGAIATDFLAGADTNVTVATVAGDVYPAITESISVQGDGFTLDTADASGTFGEDNYVAAQILPHQFPTEVPTGGAAEDVFAEFACSGGSCGEQSTATVKAFVVSGRATTQTIPGGAPDYYMPAAGATETYTTFQCAFIGANTAELTKGFIEAVLSVNPTRIETRTFRFAGELTGDGGLNSLNILVGHGHVGHATP